MVMRCVNRLPAGVGSTRWAKVKRASGSRLAGLERYSASHR